MHTPPEPHLAAGARCRSSARAPEAAALGGCRLRAVQARGKSSAAKRGLIPGALTAPWPHPASARRLRRALRARRACTVDGGAQVLAGCAARCHSTKASIPGAVIRPFPVGHPLAVSFIHHGASQWGPWGRGRAGCSASSRSPVKRAGRASVEVVPSRGPPCPPALRATQVTAQRDTSSGAGGHGGRRSRQRRGSSAAAPGPQRCRSGRPRPGPPG
jgi:hypothetical protein